MDALSKWLTATYLPLIGTSSLVYPYGGLGLFRDFLGIQGSLVHAINHGMAWGAFNQYQTPLLIVRLVLVVCIFAYLCFFNRYRRRQWPLVILLAGAVGNVLDAFLYGHVVDMFFFRFWGYSYPIFNVADILICTGVAWLLVLSFATKKDAAETA